MDALKEQGDLLNGVLLIAIGGMLLIVVVFLNIKNTSFVYGLVMSLIMEVFYAAATPVMFFALIMVVAFFADTKPVYNIND